MAHIFYKNPKNGTYAIFDTVIDQFIYWDADDLDELKAKYVSDQLKYAEESLKIQFDSAIDRMETIPRRLDWEDAKKEHNSKQKDKAYKIK